MTQHVAQSLEDGRLCVLVTRPEPSAGRTADHLRDLGFATIVAPLPKIEPLAPRMALDEQHRYVATSANAFLAPPPQGFQFNQTRDFICVGEKTARAGVSWGLPDPTIVAPDVRTLLERTNAAGLKITRWPIAYFAGRDRSPQIEEALDEAAARYQVFETYRAPPIARPFEGIDLAQIDAVLLMSPRAAERFGGAWDSDFSVIALCLSDNVRASLPWVIGRTALVSDQPNFQSLLHSLERLADQ